MVSRNEWHIWYVIDKGFYKGKMSTKPCKKIEVPYRQNASNHKAKTDDYTYFVQYEQNNNSISNI